MTKEMERNGLMGERLLKLRNQSSLTQEELAERLDVSRQSISKWELNKTLPDVDKLIQLSEMYQVSIDYLIKGEEARREERNKGENEVIETVDEHRGTDKTGDEEKKGGEAGKGDIAFAVKQIILLICIFLSGFMCLCTAVFTGRLLINNAFDREGGPQEVVNVNKIYEQYAKGEQMDGGISYGETFAEAIADVYLNKAAAADASRAIVGAAFLLTETNKKEMIEKEEALYKKAAKCYDIL